MAVTIREKLIEKRDGLKNTRRQNFELFSAKDNLLAGQIIGLEEAIDLLKEEEKKGQS